MKGQSATEQLITYGWAGMIIVVVVGVMIYFGAFNMMNRIPERCVFQNGFLCKSSRIFSDAGQLSVRFEVVNKLSKKITVTGILCSAELTDPATGYPSRPLIAVNIDVDPEYPLTQTIPCYTHVGVSSAEGVDAYEGLIYVRYNERNSGFGVLTTDHLMIGNIGGRVN
ncbi:MAG: hypothetical protein ABIG39_01275 [Candidatus Micrarchaeota archaeon]